MQFDVNQRFRYIEEVEEEGEEETKEKVKDKDDPDTRDRRWIDRY